MNRSETKVIINILFTAYPNTYKNYTEEQAKLLGSIWYATFKNIPVDLVKRALNEVIKKRRSEFAPPLGEVNARLKQYVSVLDAEAQWNNVMFIVRECQEQRHIACRKYLDDIAQTIVNEYYIRRIQEGRVNTGVEHSLFINQYNKLKEEAEDRAIETGNLLLISNEKQLARVGIALKDLPQIASGNQIDGNICVNS